MVNKGKAAGVREAAKKTPTNPLRVCEMHAEQNLLVTEPVGGEIRNKSGNVTGREKELLERTSGCKEERVSLVCTSVTGVQIPGKMWQVGKILSPSRSSQQCSAALQGRADAITASASQGTPPFPWEKTSAGTPSVLQQLGSHMRLHFQKKKYAFLSLSLGMMGAVVPWPEQGVSESHF